MQVAKKNKQSDAEGEIFLETGPRDEEDLLTRVFPRKKPRPLCPLLPHKKILLTAFRSDVSQLLKI